MLRKFIKRTFQIGAAVFGVAIVTLLVAAYLATSEPSFYSTLDGQTRASAADTAQAEQLMSQLEQWSQKSRNLQRKHQRLAARGAKPEQIYDPKTDTHELRLSEQQLNQQLASRGSGSMSAPRIRVLDDRMLIGAQFDAGRPLVFSIEVQPTVSNGSLQLDIQSSRLGKLPFPLRTVLGWLAQFPDFKSDEFKLDLSGPTPVFLVDITPRGSKYPKIRSVRCIDGELAIEFNAPILKESVAHRP